MNFKPQPPECSRLPGICPTCDCNQGYKDGSIPPPNDTPCQHLTVDKAELPSGVIIIHCKRCDAVIGESIASPVSAAVLTSDDQQPSLFGGAA